MTWQIRNHNAFSVSATLNHLFAAAEWIFLQSGLNRIQHTRQPTSLFLCMCVCVFFSSDLIFFSSLPYSFPPSGFLPEWTTQFIHSFITKRGGRERHTTKWNKNKNKTAQEELLTVSGYYRPQAAGRRDTHGSDRCGESEQIWTDRLWQAAGWDGMFVSFLSKLHHVLVWIHSAQKIAFQHFFFREFTL